MSETDYPELLRVDSIEAWIDWLKKHHQDRKVVWLGKKPSGLPKRMGCGTGERAWPEVVRSTQDIVLREKKSEGVKDPYPVNQLIVILRPA